MKKKEEQNRVEQTVQPQAADAAAEVEAEITQQNMPEETAAPDTAECEALRAALTEQKDTYLRLAAEYDNYRKRTTKEKETIWTDARAQTVAAFLPVYDNLDRAVRQETEDAAYAKGVQMTLDQLKDILTKLGVEEIPALGQPFDPERHNAVMHIERDDVGKNIITEVYQTGFQTGEKIIRHSMVVVAN